MAPRSLVKTLFRNACGGRVTNFGEDGQLDALLKHSDAVRRQSEALGKAFKDLQRRIAKVIERRASPRAPRGPDRRATPRLLEPADRRKTLPTE